MGRIMEPQKMGRSRNKSGTSMMPHEAMKGPTTQQQKLQMAAPQRGEFKPAVNSNKSTT